jgi:predicted glycosyltransferase
MFTKTNKMSYTVAFYIHHHGAGHFMRSLAIAKALRNTNIVFLGSGLSPFKDDIPANIRLIDLPLDVAKDDELARAQESEVDCFHYAPLQVRGVTQRVALVTKFFMENQPVLLIVDVSVEVALLARLCGIPTVVMRQHGERTDLPHILAYQSAELLIAPFSKEMETSKDDNVLGKTFYSGGFSRYEAEHNPVKIYQDQVAIIIGQGGSSIDAESIYFIAKTCPTLYFHVLGDVALSQKEAVTNVTFHGRIGNVKEVLLRCGLVIGNLGHNTVMEVAALNKPFIGIPEPRPFNEQIDKAKSIQDNEGFIAIFPEEIKQTEWNNLISGLLAVNPKLKDILNQDALEEIAATLKKKAKKLFS